MMSKKQFACMLTLHIVYLLVGAAIFYHIESPLELANRAEEKLERLEIQNLLYENYIPDNDEKQDSILRKLSEYCGKPLFNYTTADMEPPFKWDFYHSFFFSYTVVSTIGYGNLAPTTHLSRSLMIFYGLFGIPINGILLANLGEFFGLQLISVYRKYKKKNKKRAGNLDYCFQNLGLLGQIFLYLVPGFLFFIFLPACLFVVFEGWDYVAAIYVAFVTLTTIGFGDLVPGTINNGFKHGIFFVYQIFLIVWITLGLGYIVMLLGFITSGMRSESVHKFEKKLASKFKQSQKKILQGFTKDMTLLRRIINEANVIKVKPVYIEPAPLLVRSASCPVFTYDVQPRFPIPTRKRANSENIHLSAKDLLRIQSDTDLLGIDKEKTFSTTAIVRPTDLLARVINVLGELERPPDQRGVNMFDDEQILESEKPPVFSIGNEVISDSPKRNRAFSVAVPYNNKDSPLDGEWVPPHEKPPPVRSGKLSLPNNMMPPLIVDKPQAGLWAKIFQNQEATESPAEYLKKNMKDRVTVAQAVNENVKEVKFKPARRGSIFPTFDFSEEDDEVDEKALKAYQQKKRHSIFPTFDFDEDDEDEDDMAKKYKETTRRGRKSIFPTFDFSSPKEDEEDDDTIDEEELRRYQDKTKKGRLSLFPTFGKKKQEVKKRDSVSSNESNDLEASVRQFRNKIQDRHGINDEEDDTINEVELQRYQNKTKKGRLSLFPTFGKKKSDEEPVKTKEEEEDTIDEEELHRYQNKTKKGRLSLFPTFGKKKSEEEEDKKEEEEDDTIDEDELQRYQNKTKKGRLSLFPTFGKKKQDVKKRDSVSSNESNDLEASVRQFRNKIQDRPSKNEDEDETIDEEELQRYQNNTKKGRLSLFPTFGKNKNENKKRDSVSSNESNDLEASVRQFRKKMHNVRDKKDEEDDTIDEKELQRYQNRTKKGRLSLFPTFGKKKNEDKKRDSISSNESNDLEDSVKQFRNMTQGGRISGHKSSKPPKTDEDEVLEQTSVADLLRALAVLETAAPQTGEPSILELLTQPNPASARRRGSVRPDFALPTLLSKLEPQDPGPKKRRVSARAAAPGFNPTLATVVAGAELQTTAMSARENRMAMLAQPTESKEEAQQQKIRRFSPNPGGPVKSTGPVPRLFSRIRNDSVPSVEEEESSRRGSLKEVVIDKNKDVT